ncbi:ComEC/Rec2 family competence protein [Pseudopedobacter beijingensis]|uniref:ComEC/Rec2 family competence protein n=1 Tax=Pseudopedobacter beijingensis TaxID=1207056 RepID=A0ABW4ID37_9SPHI
MVKQEIPFFRQVFFFIAGIETAIRYQLPIYPAYLSWSISLILLILFIIISKQKKRYHHNWIPGILISILFFISGLTICLKHQEINYNTHFSKKAPKYLTVTVQDNPRTKGDIARFPVRIKHIIDTNNLQLPAKGNLLLAVKFDTLKKLNIKYGDQLLIRAKFSETEAPYNPAEFNYKKHLSFKRIYHQSFINTDEIISLNTNKGNPIIAFSLNFREKLVHQFKKHLENKNSQSVASTLILGDRSELDEEILTAYQKTGTLHILSVSGMHVAIVVLLLNFLFKPLEKNKLGRAVRLISMLILIWFYSLLTGLDPSILRAAVMLSFVLIARFIAVKTNTYNIIAATALFILMIDPFNIRNIGFQLSFLAVLGLIYYYPKLYHLLYFKNRFLDLVWQCAAVSIAAQITTTPLSLLYFHQFPVYFVVSNLFMALPSSVIMYLGFLFLFTGALPQLQTGIGWLLNHFIDWSNKGLIFIEKMPFSVIEKIWVTSYEALLLYLLLLSLIPKWKSKIIGMYLFTFLSILLTLSFSYRQIAFVKQQHTIFFSLRKNTAIAHIKGKSALLITDLDSTELTFKFSVKPYLDSCNIQKVIKINPHTYENENTYILDKQKLKIINHKSNHFHTDSSNWILLSGNKVYDLNKALKKSYTDLIIIDGRNKDYIVNKLQNQIKQTHLQYYNLKRNNALELKSYPDKTSF